MDFSPPPLLRNILEVLRKLAIGLMPTISTSLEGRCVKKELASYRDEAGLGEKHPYQVAQQSQK